VDYFDVEPAMNAVRSLQGQIIGNSAILVDYKSYTGQASPKRVVERGRDRERDGDYRDRDRGMDDGGNYYRERGRLDQHDYRDGFERDRPPFRERSRSRSRSRENYRPEYRARSLSRPRLYRSQSRPRGRSLDRGRDGERSRSPSVDRAKGSRSRSSSRGRERHRSTSRDRRSRSKERSRSKSVEEEPSNKHENKDRSTSRERGRSRSRTPSRSRSRERFRSRSRDRSPSSERENERHSSRERSKSPDKEREPEKDDEVDKQTALDGEKGKGGSDTDSCSACTNSDEDKDFRDRKHRGKFDKENANGDVGKTTPAGEEDTHRENTTDQQDADNSEVGNKMDTEESSNQAKENKESNVNMVDAHEREYKDKSMEDDNTGRKKERDASQARQQKTDRDWDDMHRDVERDQDRFKEQNRDQFGRDRRRYDSDGSDRDRDRGTRDTKVFRDYKEYSDYKEKRRYASESESDDERARKSHLRQRRDYNPRSYDTPPRQPRRFTEYPRSSRVIEVILPNRSGDSRTVPESREKSPPSDVRRTSPQAKAKSAPILRTPPSSPLSPVHTTKDTSVWDGVLCKGADNPVCRLVAYPINASSSIFSSMMFPSKLQVHSRCDIPYLAGYLPTDRTILMYFVPQSQSDLSAYEEFIKYLDSRQKAAIVKLAEAQTQLYLIPVSGHVAQKFGVDRLQCLVGAVVMKASKAQK
jgi:hypothetical protein